LGSDVIAIGLESAYNNTSNDVIALGYQAAFENTKNDVTAFGRYAGSGNAIANSFIVANDTLPKYTTRGAALTAITVLNGGTPNCTYLYCNTSIGAVEFVRL
jgi:hypothetical protein